MKISSKQYYHLYTLFFFFFFLYLILLWYWQTKKNLEATRLLAKVSYPTVSRWFSRFRDKLYHIPYTIYMRILDTLPNNSIPLLLGASSPSLLEGLGLGLRA